MVRRNSSKPVPATETSMKDGFNRNREIYERWLQLHRRLRCWHTKGHLRRRIDDRGTVQRTGIVRGARNRERVDDARLQASPRRQEQCCEGGHVDVRRELLRNCRLRRGVRVIFGALRWASASCDAPMRANAPMCVYAAQREAQKGLHSTQVFGRPHLTSSVRKTRNGPKILVDDSHKNVLICSTPRCGRK